MNDTDKEEVRGVWARDLKQCGARVRIFPRAVIVGAEWVEIGNDVIIDDMAMIFASESCPVKIGSFVHIAAFCSMAGGPVTLGDFSAISAGTRLVAGSDDFTGKHLSNPTAPAGLRRVDRRGIILGKHALVGANTVILPGVHLRDGCAVGAASLVKHSLPEWQVWAGNPCRYIRPRERDIEATTIESVRKFIKDQS